MSTVDIETHYFIHEGQVMSYSNDIWPLVLFPAESVFSSENVVSKLYM